MRFPSLGNLLNSDFINLSTEEERKNSFGEEDNVDLESHETKIIYGHPHRIYLVSHFRLQVYVIYELRDVIDAVGRSVWNKELL